MKPREAPPCRADAAAVATSTTGRRVHRRVIVAGSGRTNWAVAATGPLDHLTGGQLGANEQIARADVEQRRRSAPQLTRRLAAVDTRAAWAELVAARAGGKTLPARSNRRFARHEIAQVRYREGSHQLDLPTRRLLLQQAKRIARKPVATFRLPRARRALSRSSASAAAQPPACRQRAAKDAADAESGRAGHYASRHGRPAAGLAIDRRSAVRAASRIVFAALLVPRAAPAQARRRRPTTSQPRADRRGERRRCRAGELVVGPSSR